MFFSYYYVRFYPISLSLHKCQTKKWLFNLYLTHAVLQEKEPLFLEQLFGLLGTTG